MTQSWQRARSDEQTDVRIAQITKAAAALFRATEYEKVTLQRIAAVAGFSRSNIYRYFKNREEIFMTLYLADLNAWASDIIKGITGKMDTDSFIAYWNTVLTKHRSFLELSSLLNISLEKYSSKEVIRRIKTGIAQMLEEVGSAIATALPSLSPEEIIDFLLFNQTYLCGAWPMCHRRAIQDEVLDELGLQFMKLDFGEYMEKGIRTYMKGLGVETHAKVDYCNRM